MSITQAALRTEIMQRLGDSAGAIWASDEIDDYMQEGCDLLTMDTGCLWATDVFPDFPYAFNYTAAWEFAYFIGGDIVSGLAQFTCSFERDYIDNASGPATHNFHWEYNGGYADISGVTTEIPALCDLADELYEIERSTWNTIRLSPLWSRELENDDGRYELNKGIVTGYTQDKDGLRRLRKWRVPSSAYVPYSMDATSVAYGILIQITDVTTDTPEGDGWGDFVQVPGEHIMGDPWGVICAIYTEPNDMRIEYRRRAFALSVDQDFEFPDRYTAYVRHYAMARALEREGSGQDMELSAHFMGRYTAGVERMKQRKKAMFFQTASVMGGSVMRFQPLPRARLPYKYGVVVR